MASGLSTRAVRPFSWHTVATNPSVHRRVGLPTVRGDWCNVNVRRVGVGVR